MSLSEMSHVMIKAEKFNLKGRKVQSPSMRVIFE